MDDKGKVDSVKRCKHALILLFLYMRVGHVANQREVEGAFLVGAACDRQCAR